MRYRRAIEVAVPPEDAFAYVAEFEHTAEWDPGAFLGSRIRRMGDDAFTGLAAHGAHAAG